MGPYREGFPLQDITAHSVQMTRRINCSPPFPDNGRVSCHPKKPHSRMEEGRSGYDIRGPGNFGTPRAVWEMRKGVIKMRKWRKSRGK